MMKNLYICVMHSGTLPSEFVRLFTKGYEYSHVAFSFDNELKELYSFGRRYARSPKPSGFISYGINHKFFSLHKNGRLLVYKLNLEEEQETLIKSRLLPFLQTPRKYKYGDFNCVCHFLKIPLHRKYHHTCTSFTADMLKGIIPLDIDSSMAEPVDFTKLSLTAVYDGYFKDFKKV